MHRILPFRACGGRASAGLDRLDHVARATGTVPRSAGAAEAAVPSALRVGEGASSVLAAALAGAMLLAACTADDAARTAPDAVAADDLAPRAHERRDEPAVPFVVVPVPPGLETADLAPRDDPVARQTLGEVLAAIAPPALRPPPPDDAAPAPLPEEAAAALARAEAAIESRRDLVAVTELQRAARLAPGRPDILRPLARTITRVGGTSAADRAWGELLAVRPGDREALLALGGSALRLGRTEDALARFAGALVTMSASERRQVLADDPELARLLHVALARLGHDRAALEAAEAAIDAARRGRPVPPFPDPAGLLLVTGDLWARLGRPAEAWSAWTLSAVAQAGTEIGLDANGRGIDRAAIAASAAASGPAAIECRRLWILAGTARARRDGAAGDAPAATSGPGAADAAGELVRRIVAAFEADDARLRRLAPDLATWATSITGAGLPVGSRLVETARTRGSVAARMELLPAAEAVPLRSRRLAERPDDLENLGRLLALLARPGEGIGTSGEATADRTSEARGDRAVDLAAAVIVERPWDRAAVLARLERALPAPVVAPRDDATAEDPAVAIVRARLLLRAWSVEDAWAYAGPLVRDARFAALPAVRRLEIDLAAALDDPRRLAAALERARDLDDPWTWIARAEALSRLEDDRAVDAARAAVRRAEADVARLEDGAPAANDAGDATLPPPAAVRAAWIAAQITLCRVELAAAQAAPVNAARAETIGRVVRRAALVAERTPEAREGWAFLIDLAGDDQPLLQRIESQLPETTADGAPHPERARLLRRRDLRASRFGPALDRALRAYRTDSTDAQALPDAVAAWNGLGMMDEAARRLAGELEAHPADRRVLAALCEVLLALGRPDQAELLLATRLRREPGDVAAARQRELLLRRTERMREHAALVLDRLARRPASGRRSLQRAVARAEAGDVSGALDDLDELTALLRDGGATARHVLAGAELASRLEHPRAGAVLAGLLDAGLAELPGRMPLHLVGQALVAEVAAGDVDAALDLATRAATDSTVARLPGWSRPSAWSAVVRRLVEADRADVAARVLRAALAVERAGRARAAADAADERADRTAAAVGLATMALAADVAAGDPVDPALLETVARLGPVIAGERDEAAFGRALRWRLARLHELAGRHDDALALLRALRRNAGPDAPPEAEDAAVRAIVRLRVGGVATDPQPGELARTVDRMVAASPGDPELLGLRGVLLLRGVRPDRASASGTEALPDLLVEAAADADDGAAAAPSRSDDPVVVFAEAIRLDPSADPGLRLGYGDALEQAGRIEAAIGQWSAARDALAPDRRREAIERAYRTEQEEAWGLVVVPGEAAFARREGAILTALETRLADAAGDDDEGDG